MSTHPWQHLDQHHLDTTLSVPSAGQQTVEREVKALLPKYRKLKADNNGEPPLKDTMLPLVEKLRQRLEGNPIITTDPLLNYDLAFPRVSETYREHHAHESKKLTSVQNAEDGFVITPRSYQRHVYDRGAAHLGENSKWTTTYWAMFELLDTENVACADQTSATYHEDIGLLAASNGVHRTLAHLLIGARKWMDSSSLVVCSALWDAELEQACWDLECWDHWAVNDAVKHGETPGGQHEARAPIISETDLDTAKEDVLEAASGLRRLIDKASGLTTAQQELLFRELYVICKSSKSHIGGLKETSRTFGRFDRHLEGRATRDERQRDRSSLERLRRGGALPLTFLERLQVSGRTFGQAVRAVFKKKR